MGLRVAGVMPASMAAEAQLDAGDQITAIGGVTIDSMAALAGAMAAAATRDGVPIEWVRAGTTHASRVPVRRWPREVLADHRIEYTAVDGDGARLRAIVTAPAGPGPHPAALLLQGIRRATVDLAMSPTAPWRQLAHGLARAGVLTLRLERRGVGDSEGEFAALDFETETADARAALHALAARLDVDRARVGVFGHSAGGMIAPRIADDAATAVAVYGTASAPWFECVAASARNQSEVRGWNDESPTVLARAMAAIAAGEERELFGRCAAFHRQLAAVDLPSAWQTLAAPVLVTRGTFDWVVAEPDATALLDHIDGAALATIEGLDHAMTWHPTRAESVARYGQGRWSDAFVERLAAFFGAR